MTYIKINETLYPATIDGFRPDRSWDNRESKAITLEMPNADAAALFVDGLAWSIVMDTVREVEQTKEDGTVEIVEVPDKEEYDNSDYSIAGEITDHRDGTVSIKMGKPTQLEMMQAQLANAVTQAELETAYMEGVNSL